MPVRLNGTTGYVELAAPGAAGSNTLTLPTGNGTARQVIMTDGAGALSFVNDAGALYYRLDSNLAGANVNTAQSVFGVGVTLAASTVYVFDGLYILDKTAGTTSHTVGTGFGGTATVNNMRYVTSGIASVGTAANGTAYGSMPSGAGNNNTNFTTTTANISLALYVRGTVSINAGGTFIPQYTLSAAPGGAYSTSANSYIRFVPIGAAGSASSQGTWS